MPLSGATPDTEDLVLKPPLPPQPPLQLLYYPKPVPNTFKKTEGSLSAWDEQEHPLHKDPRGLAVHCSRVAWAAQFPAASEH